MNQMNVSRGRLSRRTLIASTIATAVVGRPLCPVRAQDNPEVNDVLAAASLRLAEVESLHFTLEVDGETYIEESGTIRLESAKGDLARPDKVAVEFQVSLLGAATVSIRMITVGETSWTTDLITGNWGEAPPEFGYNPTIIYDNQNGLGPVMGKLDEPRIEGTEEVDDREAYHVVGTATKEVIAPVTAYTMTGETVGVELWIDIETWNLLRIMLVEPESEEKDDPATWVMDLSAFDEQVTIEPPE
ncbi:MAG: LppX_LprAFG lipoprotein [Chloroflexia bacterium]|nr:LppX_LprAFG lipoprotein [Chloroflexia bacterium]